MAAQRSRGSEAGTARSAPMLGKTGEGGSAGGGVRRGASRVARRRGGSRRPRGSPPGHGLRPRPRRGRDDHRQGVATEGNRTCPSRGAQRPAPSGRRSCLRPDAARLRREDEPQGSPAGAARGAVSPRRPGQRRRDRRRGLLEPSTKQAAEALAKWGAEGSVLVVLAGEEDLGAAKSFRNIPRVTVVGAAPWEWPTWSVTPPWWSPRGLEVLAARARASARRPARRSTIIEEGPK